MITIIINLKRYRFFHSLDSSIFFQNVQTEIKLMKIFNAKRAQVVVEYL